VKAEARLETVENERLRFGVVRPAGDGEEKGGGFGGRSEKYGGIEVGTPLFPRGAEVVNWMTYGMTYTGFSRAIDAL
jgi:hypothetical protein